MKNGHTAFRRQKAAAIALDVLIGVLLFALFLQCGIYIERSIRGSRARSGMPFDMRILSASSKEASRNLEPGLLLPEAIAVREADTARAIFHSSAVLGDLYSEVSAVLLRAFSGEAVSASEEEWRTALAQDVVYVRYAAELPYQILHAFAAAEQGSGDRLYRAEPYVGVREICILPDDGGRLAGILTRGSGGVFSFSSDAALALSEVVRYAEEYPAPFYSCVLEAGESVASLSVETPVSARSAVISDRMLSLLTADTKDWNQFLRLMDFNPDKLNTHTEADGTRIYVESHGVLRANSSEIVYQATEGSGISAATLSGTSGAFDVYAGLRAASYLISRLTSMNRMYTGGDAVLMLRAVSASGESLSYHFGFRCDNIPILGDGGEDFLTLTFTGDSLTELRFHMLVVSRSLLETNTFLQTWSRSLLAPQEDAEMRLIYRIDPQTNAAMPQWAAFVTGGKEENSSWDGTD